MGDIRGMLAKCWYNTANSRLMVTGWEKEKKTVTLAPGWKDTAHHASIEAHRQMAFNWREIPIYWPKDATGN